MSATDELRRLLDERGVRWKRVRGHKDNGTSWHDAYGSYVEAVQEYAWDGGEFPEGKMVVRRGPTYMTHEQVIDATLGRGTCRRVLYKPTGVLVCSECGAGIPKQLDKYCFLHYCPNCGRRVVGE